MSYDRSWFRRCYVDAGGSAKGANSYVAYLNRFDQLCGGIEERLFDEPIDELIAWGERQTDDSFGGQPNRRHSMSAMRKYRELRTSFTGTQSNDLPSSPLAVHKPSELKKLLRQARELGASYYRLTGKPLGVTGEVAELAAAEALGIELATVRTPGYDGWLERRGVRLRVQIKGRAVDPADRYRGRCPAIKCGDQFDIVQLVLLDRSTLLPLEIWEDDEERVAEKLMKPGSKARNDRNSLAIMQFKSGARMVWRAVT